MDFLNLTRHMPRQRYQTGSLSKVGKRVKNWRGRWHVYVQVDGKEVIRKRERILGRVADMSKTDAQIELQKHIDRTNRQPGKFGGDSTFADLWGAYERSRDSEWSKITSDTIKSLFSRFVTGSSFGALPLELITPEPARALLRQLAQDGKSYSTITKIRTYLRAAMDFAVDERIIATNPLSGKKLKLPKGIKQECRRALSMEEIHQLLANTGGADHLILRLFIVCGFRPGELFALRWNDVSEDRIRVDEAIKQAESGDDRLGEPKTVTSNGIVTITPSLYQELSIWRQASRPLSDDALLFPAAQGGLEWPRNYLQRVLQPLGESEEIKVSGLTFQALRRTCATWFQKVGTVKDAQSQLRHATPMLTAQRYMQAIPESVRQAVSELDRITTPEKPTQILQ